MNPTKMPKASLDPQSDVPKRSHESPCPSLKKFSGFSSTEARFDWADGKSYSLPYIELRFQCLCAECVDEWTRVRKLERKNIKPDIKPMRVEVVGQYAVQIYWSDGHRAGIYPFDRLHELCFEKGREVL